MKSFRGHGAWITTDQGNVRSLLPRNNVEGDTRKGQWDS